MPVLQKEGVTPSVLTGRGATPRSRSAVVSNGVLSLLTVVAVVLVTGAATVAITHEGASAPFRGTQHPDERTSVRIVGAGTVRMMRDGRGMREMI